MSTREDGNPKPVTVKIIETVYVQADTADDFKSVVRGSPARTPSPPSWRRAADLLHHHKLLKAGWARVVLLVIARLLLTPTAKGRTGER